MRETMFKSIIFYIFFLQIPQFLYGITISPFQNAIIKGSSAFSNQNSNEAFSLLRGNDHHYVKQTSLLKPGNVLYIASGLDVFRPLFTFSHIKNIQLLDIGVGIPNVQNLLDQVKRRIESIPIVVDIDLVEDNSSKYLSFISSNGISLVKGFLEKIPDTVLAKWKIKTVLNEVTEERTITIRLFDRENRDLTQNTIAQVQKIGPIEGVLEAGIFSKPPDIVVKLLVDSLVSQGLYIKEMALEGSQDNPFPEDLIDRNSLNFIKSNPYIERESGARFISWILKKSQYP